MHKTPFCLKGYRGKVFFLYKNVLLWRHFYPRPFLSARQFLADESPLKVIENAFDFMLKSRSFLRYSDICPVILVI